MAHTVIGLDIDSSAARAVEIAPGTPSRARRMGQVALPAGVVHDGEVVDPAALGAALRQLWSETGFKGRTVRVVLASARVIVRPVEMPPMSAADTRAALRFQLADFVPLPPEQTVFDFQPLEADPEGPAERQVLLAAAPREVVEPVVQALRLAGLRAAHVDTAAVALARLGGSSPTTDAVVSIGPDMVVVAVTRGGQPIFARALSNLGDRSGEIAAEIGDSLAYFAAQPGGGPVQLVAVTGVGDLMAVRGEVEARLGVPVGVVDPFGSLGIDDGIVRSHPLVRALGLAVGSALGAERGRGPSINLLAERSRDRSRAARPLLIGAAALAVLLGGGALLRGQQSAIAAARDQRDQAQAEVTAARERAAERAAAGTAGATSSGAAVVAAARTADVDWTAVATQLDTIGEPLGVGITSFRGAAVTAATTDPAAAASAAAPSALGSVSISGTAPDLYVVAAWIDAVVADPRFDAAWVDGSNASADGSALEFTGVLTLNVTDLMAREQLGGTSS
jgi:Tfp pilus assembly PilM family ATPase